MQAQSELSKSSIAIRGAMIDEVKAVDTKGVEPRPSASGSCQVQVDQQNSSTHRLKDSHGLQPHNLLNNDDLQPRSNMKQWPPT